MEKPAGGSSWAWSAVVLLLGLAAFSCSIAAEFYRAKEKDMKLDGNLCSMPRTAAFGLGVAALACLSVAQVLATTAVAIRLRRSEGDKSSRSGQLVADRRRRPALTIALLVLSWVSFGLGTALLSTGTSMNRGQRYGQGWMDGKCYVVRAGVYLGSAALVALTAGLLVVVLRRRPILLVVFGGEGMMTMTAPASRHHRRTGPESDELPRQLK